MEQSCDSCGFEGASLVAVRRVYVTPETWDTPGSQFTAEPPEQWCASCRSQYPHEPADDRGAS